MLGFAARDRVGRPALEPIEPAKQFHERHDDVVGEESVEIPALLAIAAHRQRAELEIEGHAVGHLEAMLGRP